MGAEYASFQASTRLAEAESQVKTELDQVEKTELDLLTVEKNSIETWSKEKRNLGEAEMERMLHNSEILKQVKEFSEIDKPGEEIIISSKEEESFANDANEVKDPFSYLNSLDESIKITVKEESDEREENESDDSDVDKEEEIPRYKFPTY